MDSQIAEFKLSTACKLFAHLNNEPLHGRAMDHYSLVYCCNQFIHQLIAFAGRESLNEEWRPNPDKEKIRELKVLSDEMFAIQRNNQFYPDTEKMQRLVNFYAPIAKEATRLSLLWADERRQ